MAQNLMEILQQIRGGSALEEAGRDLQELVQAVRETGKAGKLIFSITVEPDKADETVVTLQPDITLKIPKRAKAKGMFYMDSHGRLTREDPRQIELELERKQKLEDAGAVALNQVGRG